MTHATFESVSTEAAESGGDNARACLVKSCGMGGDPPPTAL